MLRRVATRLPGADGERQGSTGSGASLKLLAVGDSIIDGVGTGHVEKSLPVQFARQLTEQSGSSVNWQIEGLSGLNIRGVIDRLLALDSVTPPDLVLISVGVNDVTGLSSTRSWRTGVVQVLDIIAQRWPEAHTVFAGLPPMALFPLPPQPLRFSLGLRSTLLDQIASDVIADRPNAVHVPTQINPEQHDFCDDGFHPSADSCTLWARELAIIASRREQR